MVHSAPTYVQGGTIMRWFRETRPESSPQLHLHRVLRPYAPRIGAAERQDLPRLLTPLRVEKPALDPPARPILCVASDRPLQGGHRPASHRPRHATFRRAGAV